MRRKRCPERAAPSELARLAKSSSDCAPEPIVFLREQSCEKYTFIDSQLLFSTLIEIKMKVESPVYLDYNATTPLDDDVLDAMVKASVLWANPSSSYDAGRDAKKALDEARQDVAHMINAQFPAEEIIFTSGGTESDNWVILSCIREFGRSSTVSEELPHFVTSNIEHDAITLPLKEHSRRGDADVTFVPVSKSTGAVDVGMVIGAIRRNTVLVTIMLANNETGILQPVKEIGKALREVNAQRKTDGLAEVLFHTDAAQVFGKLLFDAQELQVDYVTIVGHKFYAPRIGGLYCRRGAPLHPLFFGGGQERGLRPGTENIMSVVGLGKAASLVVNNIDHDFIHLQQMKNYLESRLIEVLQDQILINFNYLALENRLPNTTSVSFADGRLKGTLILKMATKVRASVGAACHSAIATGKSYAPSTVLLNSGLDAERASCTLRLSVGRQTTRSQIDDAVNDIAQAVKVLSKNNLCENL